MGIQLVQWSEEIQTGVLWQDVQHQELLEKIHQLYEVFLKNEGRRGKEEIEETLHFLEQYVRNHFLIEERYMELLEYPKRKEHKKEHQNFIKNLTDLKFQSNDLAMISSASLCYDLNQWFIIHIKTTDMELGSFIQILQGQESTRRKS